LPYAKQLGQPHRQVDTSPFAHAETLPLCCLSIICRKNYRCREDDCSGIDTRQNAGFYN